MKKDLQQAAEKVEFVNDTLSYLILCGRWHDIIIVNVHKQTENKDDKVRDSSMEN